MPWHVSGLATATAEVSAFAAAEVACSCQAQHTADEPVVGGAGRIPPGNSRSSISCRSAVYFAPKHSAVCLRARETLLLDLRQRLQTATGLPANLPADRQESAFVPKRIPAEQNWTGKTQTRVCRKFFFKLSLVACGWRSAPRLVGHCTSARIFVT